MFTIPEFLNAMGRLYEVQQLPDRLLAIYAGDAVIDVDLSKCPYAEIDMTDFQDFRKKVRKAFVDYIGDTEKSKLLKDISNAFNDGSADDDDDKPKANWGWGKSSGKGKKKAKIKPKKCVISRFQIARAADFIEKASPKDTILLAVFTDPTDGQGGRIYFFG